MLLRTSCSDRIQRTNILIWCMFVMYLSGLQVSASEDFSAMTTKLHQKLIEDIRLHKRLVGLLDEQDRGSKERRGSYQSPLHRIEPHHKQSGRMHEVFRNDDEDKIYISGDNRRNSRLERERCRPKSMEASNSRYELVPYETQKSSKSIKPFEGVPDFYPQEQKVNSINKRVHSVSNGIAGSRHRNSDRADDGRLVGAFANPTHNHNRISKKSNHRHRRSLDLGEINRQYFSDSDITNAHQQRRSYLQLAEIPGDAQKLEHLLKERSGGDGGCRNLLKGAMDLEESLRILAKLQKATGSLKPTQQRPRQSVDLQDFFPYSYDLPPRYSFDGRKDHPRLSLDGREVAKTTNFDLKDAIRSSLNRQKMLYSTKTDVFIQKKDNFRPMDSIRGSNSGTQKADNKKRIPNVIARLMGLEELPSDSRPKLHTNSNPVSDRIAEVKTDSLTQARKSLKDSGDGQKGYIFMNSKEYHDTIKAALRQIKKQTPPKPSFEEELALKLNRLYKSDDHQKSEQEPKTLKQILETMQMKGILDSNPDQTNPKVGIDTDVVHMEEDVRVLKPVIEMKKATRKAQDLHERPLQTSSLLQNETTITRNSAPNPSNKIPFKGAPTSPSSPSIVIIKPVTKAQNPTELPPKNTTASRNNNKDRNLVKNTDAKKKIGLSELNRSVDEGESKKKNHKNSSVSDGPLQQRPKQRTRSSGDGGLQKQIKSQKLHPTPDLQELRKKRSERISKTNKGTTSSTPKTEKQKRVHDLKTNIKPKVNGSRPRSRASMDRISPDIQEIDARSSHIHGELSQLPIDQKISSASKVENNIEENREKMPENPDVEVEPASEDDENPVSKLSSRSDHHKINSLEDVVTVSTISPVSVLELPTETDPQEVEEEEAEVALTDGEIQEEEEQDEDSLIKDLDDKTDIFSSSAQQPLNYGHKTKLTGPFFDTVETDCKEYVWQIITKNVTLMDNLSVGVDQTEIYSQLYHKLEEIEIPSFCGLEAGKQWQSVDTLERRLVLDCIKEVLQRKARLRLQMKQPILSSRRIRKVSLGLKRNSISDLVQELRDDVAELMSYQQVLPSQEDLKNETIGEDFLYGVLQKDINMGNVGVISIWNPSWDNGMYGEQEAHDCVRDIENMVFDELVEEIVCDFGLG